MFVIQDDRAVGNNKIEVESMTEDEFYFKSDVDMNALTKQIGESLAQAIGGDPLKLKCKGIRIFYTDENDMLMSSGLFVKGFSPEDWDDDSP